MNLYRTRWYAVLCLFCLIFIFSKRFRSLFYRQAGKLNTCRKWKVSLLLFLITLVAGLLMIYPGKSWGGDYSQYYAQARALVTGTIPEWFRKNSFIIDNSCDGIGSDVYPWMWSIMLAPVYMIFHGFPVIVVKVYEVVLLAAGSLFMIQIFMRRMTNARAFALSLFVTGSYQFLCNVNAADADIPGFFWSMAALCLADRYLKEREISFSSSTEKIRVILLLAAGTGAAAAAAMLTKTLCEGIILALAAYDLLSVIRKRFFNGRVWWVQLVPYLSFIVCKELCDNLLMKSGGTYKSYFTFSSGRFLMGVRQYFYIFSAYFGSGVRPLITAILVVITVLFLVLTAAGMLMKWKEEMFFAFYVCGMLLMLLFYNYYRYGFTYSFYPLMLLFASYAVCSLRNKGDTVLVDAAVLTALLLVLAQSLYGIYATRFRGYRLDEAESDTAEELYRYIDQNLDKEDVVYFFKPRVLYWSTGVNSYFWGLDDTDHLDKADYVLLSKWDDQTKCYQYVNASQMYQQVFSNEGFILYEKQK